VNCIKNGVKSISLGKKNGTLCFNTDDGRVLSIIIKKERGKFVGKLVPVSKANKNEIIPCNSGKGIDFKRVTYDRQISVEEVEGFITRLLRKHKAALIKELKRL